MNESVRKRAASINKSLDDFWEYNSEAALEAIIYNAAVALALLRGEVEEK